MAASESHDEDLDSLPSISSDMLSSEASESPSDAQKEWEESLEQIQLLLTMVVVPFAGKYLGRKFAYWSTFPLATRPASVSLLAAPGGEATNHALLANEGTPNQAGRGTWNGRTTSRYGGPTRRPGQLQVSPRRLPHYDKPHDWLPSMLVRMEESYGRAHVRGCCGRSRGLGSPTFGVCEAREPLVPEGTRKLLDTRLSQVLTVWPSHG